MKERQIMQKNLARLLRQIDYKSCGSDIGDQVQDCPANPFMKRVFQKKLRRSSVASENVNPNSSLRNQSIYEQNDHKKIKQIIAKGHTCLDRLEKRVIQSIDSNKGKQGGNTSVRNSKIIQRLYNQIQQIRQHIQRNEQQILDCPASITHIQHYQCQGENEHSNISTAKKSKQKLKQSSSKQGNKNKSTQIANSHVSQSSTNKPSHYKSVYESVLEERRNRKGKNSRII